MLRALIDGRSLIEDPRHWVQGPFSTTDEDGTVRRCSAAAINYARGRIPGSLAARAYLKAAAPSRYQGRLGAHILFSDDPTTTHADMLGMWDRAIAARREYLTERAAQRVESVS